MLTQLTPQKYPTVQKIFSSLTKTQPMCTAVLEGVYPGKIFVDNPDDPRSAFLATYIKSEASGTWGFLAGDPTNEAFNRALNTAIFDRQVIHKDSPILFLACDPGDWGGHMDTVLSPRPPIWVLRYHFVSRKVDYDWRAALPVGYAVEPIHEDMLTRPGLELPSDIAETLTKWQAAKQANERFADYGFVTLDHTGETPVISSWATVDFVANGMGDLGFFTQPNYRRKGLGTIAAAVAIEHGLNDGLTQVNWTCAAENPGSYSAAEKLELEKIEDYKMVLLLMNEERHQKLVEEMG
jgi:RimJ/RimL family protein N-acetyltransferase